MSETGKVPGTIHAVADRITSAGGRALGQPGTGVADVELDEPVPGLGREHDDAFAVGEGVVDEVHERLADSTKPAAPPMMATAIPPPVESSAIWLIRMAPWRIMKPPDPSWPISAAMAVRPK